MSQDLSYSHIKPGKRNKDSCQRRNISLTLSPICRAAIEENAYNRMKKVVKWYISGFYKKPKVRGTPVFCRVATTIKPVALNTTSLVTCCPSQGLKKPYNPIIGETFRCMWLHQKTNSKTFYIAEQVTLSDYCIFHTHSSYFPLSR